MATVPSFITWTAGQIVTAANNNGQIRDPGNFFLSVPVCQVRQTVAQSFTTAVSAVLTFDTEDFYPDNMHSTVTNTDRLTAVTAGRYQFSGGPTWVTNATGIRAGDWQINATAVNGGSTSVAAVTGFSTRVACRVVTVFLNVNDFVNLLGFQNSGGPLNTANTTNEQSLITARWLGTT